MMKKNTMPMRLMTINEVVAYTRLGHSSLYRAMARGELVGVLLGKSRRFRLSEVDAFIDTYGQKSNAEKQPVFTVDKTKADKNNGSRPDVKPADVKPADVKPADVKPADVKHVDRLGKLHRENGPAVEYSDGTKLWFRHGELHRVGAPAAVYSNGTQEWYENGLRHRLGGPAVYSFYGMQPVYVDGKICGVRDEAEWWVNGVKFSHLQYMALTAVITQHSTDNILEKL